MYTKLLVYIKIESTEPKGVDRTGVQDFAAPTLGHSVGGRREVDPGTAELRSQVVDVSGKQDSNSKEDSDGDSSGLGLLGGGCSDNTVFTNDLDAFNVRTRAFVGVVNIHASLAFSRNGVDVVANIAQFVFSVVVSCAVHADLRDHGSVTVRNGESHGLVEGVLSALGERSAGIVSEQTEVDLSTLVSAVGPEVVGSAIVVLLIQTASTYIDLCALNIIQGIEVAVGKLTATVA